MNGLRKINTSIDYRNEIETKDVSKIDLANEAATFIFGFVQHILGINKHVSQNIPGISINIIPGYNINTQQDNVNYTINVNNGNCLHKDKSVT